MSGGDSVRVSSLCSQRRQSIGGAMRRTVGVQCSERQLWCELLPFAALLPQAEMAALHRGQLAPLVSYSSGVQQRSVPSKQLTSVARVSVSSESFSRQVAAADSAAASIEEDEIEDIDGG